MIRKYLTLLFIFIVCTIFIIPTNPMIVMADDGWKLQLTDPKDSPIKPDIKAIFMKEDNDYLYVKFEGYNNWEFKITESMAIYFNTQGDNDWSHARYFLMIGALEDFFIGQLVDMKTDNEYPCKVDFSRNKSIGTADIPKSYIDNKLRSFSFLGAIGSLDYDDFLVDIAPDSGIMKRYERGPSKEPPKLNVTPESINLGSARTGEKLSSELEISNSGGGTLKISISASNNAIIVNPSQFSLSEYESMKVTITVETRNLSPGQYFEKLNITSNGGDAVVNVSFEILKLPELYFEPSEIDFGEIMKGEKASENIEIGNKNKGPINVKISSNEDWLVISKKNFEAEKMEIKITAITSKLDPGDYEGKIRITSDGGNGEINVTIKVVKVLSINSEKIDFGKIFSNKLEVEPTKLLIKNNSRKDKISVKVNTDSNWIKVDNGTLDIEPEKSKELEVGVNFNYIKTFNKVYVGKITLDAKVDKIEVEVMIEVVEPEPQLQFKLEEEVKKIEGSIIIGEIFEKKITLTNSGGGTLKVKAYIKDDSLPIKLNKDNITLKANESYELILSLDLDKVQTGTIETYLILDSNGGKAEIPILIEVKPKPEIKIRLYIGNAIAFIDDRSFILDAPPYIKKGTTFVPLRFISEAFGAKVEWQNIGKGRVFIKFKDKEIILDIGSTNAFINNKLYTLLAPPEIINGRTFVPVRFISEGLGAKVLWNASLQEVTILYQP